MSSDPSSSTTSDSSSSTPSMLSGHAKYAQGAISSALGYETGEATKSSGLQEMRDAKQANQDPSAPPAQNGLLGTVENLAGKATGCEGMEKEGETRKGVTQAAGIESQSGTG